MTIFLSKEKFIYYPYLYNKPMKTGQIVLQIIENEWPASVTIVVEKLNEMIGSKFSLQSI